MYIRVFLCPNHLPLGQMAVHELGATSFGEHAPGVAALLVDEDPSLSGNAVLALGKMGKAALHSHTHIYIYIYIYCVLFFF